jgi:hypothetical protein
MDAAKAKSSVDPWRYFEGVCTDSDRPVQEPVCLYLETTNRCNLYAPPVREPMRSSSRRPI